MCGFSNNCSWILIIILLLICCGGQGGLTSGNNGCGGCGCDNNCGCC